MTTNKEKLAAVADLRHYDHCFIGPNGVESFNNAFRVNIKPYVAKADPHNPKGLTLNGGAKEALGYDAASYAEAVCRELKSTFNPWQSGRGFRLRSACDALEALFKSEQTAAFEVEQ